MATAAADLSFLEQPALIVAPQLLGWQLVHQTPEGPVSGIIVETEAYMGTIDPASHAFRGQTARNAIMFGPAGRLYVYFTYGLHYCCNVVTGPSGAASAVLIRALEPVAGTELMMVRRDTQNLTNLTNGPAKLTQALGLDKAMNGHDLLTAPLQLLPGRRLVQNQIIASPRVGITTAADRLWRFSIKDHPYVSKPKPKVV